MIPSEELKEMREKAMRETSRFPIIRLLDEIDRLKSDNLAFRNQSSDVYWEKANTAAFVEIAELKRRLGVAEEALEFYANEENYGYQSIAGPVDFDSGDKAKNALLEIRGEK